MKDWQRELRNKAILLSELETRITVERMKSNVEPTPTNREAYDNFMHKAYIDYGTVCSFINEKFVLSFDLKNRIASEIARSFLGVHFDNQTDPQVVAKIVAIDTLERLVKYMQGDEDIE
jgi:hypothetical protein